jgi:hypothetical protein
MNQDLRTRLEEAKTQVANAGNYGTPAQTRAARAEFYRIVHENQVTQADLLRVLTGKEPCCEEYHPTEVAAGKSWRTADGTLVHVHAVVWCQSCGALNLCKPGKAK